MTLASNADDETHAPFIFEQPLVHKGVQRYLGWPKA